MNEILLSICIPTYNREKYLDTLLSKLYTQISKYKLDDIVEIGVTDNCSNDATENTIQKYLGKGLQYFKQSRNLGAGSNFLTGFGMAKGEYVWLLSDDDGLTEDVLQYVYRMIKDGKVDYLYLRTGGDVSVSPVRTGTVMFGDYLMSKVLIHTTFISSQIIKRSLLQPYIAEAKSLSEPSMAYFLVYLRALENAKECLISESREIIVNPDNTGGYNFFDVWPIHCIDTFNQSMFSKNKKIERRFKNNLFYDLIIPFTYKMRCNNINSRFLDGLEGSFEKVCVNYSSLVKKKILLVYLKSPRLILLPFNLAVRCLFKLYLLAINKER